MSTLLSDPSSLTFTSFNGWDYPFPRLEAMVADLWDATAIQVYKKPKPYPRPIPAQPQTRHHGNVAGRTPEEVKALLSQARAGHFDAPV